MFLKSAPNVIDENSLHPDLYKKFTDATPEYEFKIACSVRDNMRKVASNRPKKTRLVLMPGLNSSFATLYDEIDESDKPIWIAVERNWSKIAWFLLYTQVWDLVQEGRFLLVDDETVAASRLSGISTLFLRNTLWVPAAECNDMDWIIDVMEKYLMPMSTLSKTSVATQVMNASVTGDNLLWNMYDYIKSRKLMNLSYYKGWLDNKTDAVVVSAGPSIDKWLPLLKERQKDYAIIACLTMLKPLLNNGIKPHFITALDYHKVSAQFLDGIESLKDYVCIFEPKVNNEVVKAALNLDANIIYNQNFWLDYLVSKNDSINECGYIMEGSTVAHLSFIFAKWMAARNIILLGQDLSFPESKYYPDCVLEAHPWKKTVNLSGRRLLVVYDKNGKGVYTDEQMQSYLSQFCTIIHTLGSDNVYNCSDGVKIAGAIDIDFKEYCASHDNGLSIDKTYSDLINKIRTVKSFYGTKDYVDMVDNKIRKIKKLLDFYKKCLEFVGTITEDNVETKKEDGHRLSEEGKLHGTTIYIAENYSGLYQFKKEWCMENFTDCPTEHTMLDKIVLDGELMRDIVNKTEMLIKTLEQVKEFYSR